MTDAERAAVLWDELLRESPVFRGALLWEGDVGRDENKAGFLRKWAGMFDSAQQTAPKKGEAPASEVAEVPVPPMGSGGRMPVPITDLQVGDVVHYWSKYKGGRNAVGRVKFVHKRKGTIDVVPSGKIRSESVLPGKIERVERGPVQKG